MAKKMSWTEGFTASFSILKSLFFDDIEEKLDIPRPDGGTCECQIRRHRQTLEKYLVLKTEGVEGHIWIPFDADGARQLMNFIQSALAEKKS